MEDAFRVARKLAVDTQTKLSLWETSTSLGQQSELQIGAQDSLRALESASQQIHTLVPRVEQKKRDYWNSRVMQLDEEISALQKSFENLCRKRHADMQEQQMRQDLFRERIQHHGDASIPIGSFASLEQERQSLSQSDNMMNGILTTGRAALETLQKQRITMKGTKKKLIDVANKIGVGKELIRKIEAKENETALLVYGGMFVMTIILIILFIWKKLL
eukprot:CAMPEP_0184695100 /NCGR_PEP_ID=MMETSP0313-20130426/2841_1 /TAXON_ID=2792 /ORGANISM="Porphyridium aerugineum, Strain SAG 1380-2" /LENGTH=217 /DNA_ID=CAMNT_0027153493 /DNA_START=168 /DNA_END=821 /DNA_ORIENTATION=-